MDFIIVGICIIVIVGLYFFNNPLGHGGWFLTRRFINWFPLGMTYAFLYMGRYNLNVAKNSLGATMPNADFGTIFMFGTIVYGCSFLLTGPLVDKIGGKRGILIAAVGTAVANVMLGVLTYLLVTGKTHVNVILAYSVLYSVNMFFQSFGGVSIIKVKAYWFHVRERGMFGAIFGSLISIGIYFAFDWGEKIVAATKAVTSNGGWFSGLLKKIFASDVLVNGIHVDATWAVFFIPAVILVFWILADIWLIKDAPEEAGFPAFDTHDASSGQMHIEYTTTDLLKKFFSSKLMLMIALIGLTSGVFRHGIQNWYFAYSKQVPQAGAEFISNNWGLWLCIFGIVGGFFAGGVSDYLFQSRRGPPAAILAGLVLIMTLLITVFLKMPVVLGFACLMVLLAAIGLTSIMSGTAATDFGGRKATATCSGIVDGFTYLGGGIQSFCIGHLIPSERAGDSATFLGITRDWHWWPIFMVPFAIIGLTVAIKIWHELPEATRKFNARSKTASDSIMTELQSVTATQPVSGTEKKE